tara:strand:+ start:71705 stop:72235 length:531 start_codon:yes stop_codon:yes gene_type:complete
MILLLLLNILNACENKTEYESIVERELKKTERADSLFLGYYFGMTTSDFFDHSRQLNSDGRVTGQTTIHYSHDDLGNSVTKYFYPSFANDRIYRLPIEASYDGWAPWNRSFFSDTLIVDLIEMYNQKYGTEFIYTDVPDKEDSVWVGVQSNRRIVLNKKDDMTVQIEFLDLSVQYP